MSKKSDVLTAETCSDTGRRRIRFPIRWWVIASLPVASTMLNHLDRNVLANAAPALRKELSMDEIALSWAVICF